MVRQPGLDAVRVEGVATGKEHRFVTELEISDADRASRVLESSVLKLLAVLFFDRHFWKSVDVVLVCRSLCLFFILLLHLSVQLINKVGEVNESFTIVHLVEESKSFPLAALGTLVVALLVLSSWHAASEILVIVHAEFMRVEILTLLRHPLESIIVEH
jgi:hypothetical protein